MNVSAELSEIGKLIDSVALVGAIRRETNVLFQNKSALVMDGAHANGKNANYDVVIVHHGDGEHNLLARRIRSIRPDMQVDELVDNVIGIKNCRRGKNG